MPIKDLAFAIFIGLFFGTQQRRVTAVSVEEVHKQLYMYWGVQGGLKPGSRAGLPATVSGIYAKHRQICIRTNPVSGVLGLHSQLCDDVAKSSCRETKQSLGGVSKTTGGRASVSPNPLEINWQNEYLQSGNPTSPTVLQKPPDWSDNSLKSLRSGLQSLKRHLSVNNPIVERSLNEDRT